MTMWGEIEVNSGSILNWAAENTGEQDETGRTKYRVTASSGANVQEWDLWHRPDKGAAFLASRIMLGVDVRKIIPVKR